MLSFLPLFCELVYSVHLQLGLQTVEVLLYYMTSFMSESLRH